MVMIVYQLRCSRAHTFEGWFRSAEAFESQQATAMIECPVCHDVKIERVPAGVNLSRSELPAARDERRLRALERAKRRQAESSAIAPSSMSHEVVMSEQHSELLQAMKSFLTANTENVGSRFADVARRMHDGEEPHRSIRGKVTTEEAIALHDEGIPAWPVPPGIIFNEDSQ
jgi:hypothetical protein